MNADRLIRMGLNMLMRHGLRWFSKRQEQKPTDPRLQQAASKMRMLNRICRM